MKDKKIKIYVHSIFSLNIEIFMEQRLKFTFQLNVSNIFCLLIGLNYLFCREKEREYKNAFYFLRIVFIFFFSINHSDYIFASCCTFSMI